jgi:hypothetical protein
VWRMQTGPEWTDPDTGQKYAGFRGDGFALKLVLQGIRDTRAPSRRARVGGAEPPPLPRPGRSLWRLSSGICAGCKNVYSYIVRLQRIWLSSYYDIVHRAVI